MIAGHEPVALQVVEVALDALVGAVAEPLHHPPPREHPGPRVPDEPRRPVVLQPRLELEQPVQRRVPVGGRDPAHVAERGGQPVVDGRPAGLLHVHEEEPVRVGDEHRVNATELCAR